MKNTSVGYDEISTNVLKRAAQSLAKPIAHVANLMFETATFPEKLKLTTTKPIFKKGEKPNCQIIDQSIVKCIKSL